MMTQLPRYLNDYESDWSKNPLSANLQWFKGAGRGLFLHFSPASVLSGSKEWQALDTTYQEIHHRFGEFDDAQYDYWMDTIFTDTAINADIRAVWDRFSPDRFDAYAIADLAVAAGMKYITFTTRHVCGRMFLFETQTSPCNSVSMKPHRDFVRELAEACAARRLGLFLYVMPPFDDKRGRVGTMLSELLTQYGPIAGIWFDGIARYYQRPDRFQDVSRLYQLVRSHQPGCLVSFKTGATGEEDFIAPEWHQCLLGESGERKINSRFTRFMTSHPTRTVTRYNEELGFHERHEDLIDLWQDVLRHKPLELCATLQEKGWFNREGVKHASLETARSMCEHARSLGGNLLLNTGPLGDGSIHPQDRATLIQLGKQQPTIQNNMGVNENDEI